MNDAAAALEQRIHAGIPLSRSVQFHIAELDGQSIRVAAPLAPNINVHGTGFAGSLYALGILTAWAMAAHLLQRAGLEAELVVASASIRYREPVTSDFECLCRAPATDAMAFIDRLRENGRSRIPLQVEIGTGPAAIIEALMHARAA
ncbi:MAG: YiiD C-terminal domain-containing protein [Gammaproteobacteria bacterium]|nr:YiiD C-terminal domain-containing protein [Gammaproteobacteria bacterium]